MEDLIKGELDWHNKVNENFHEVDSQMAESMKQLNDETQLSIITSSAEIPVTNERDSISTSMVIQGKTLNNVFIREKNGFVLPATVTQSGTEFSTSTNALQSIKGVSLRPNTLYTISLYIKSSNALTITESTAKSFFRVDGDNNTLGYVLGDIKTEYTKFVFTFTTLSTGYIDVIMRNAFASFIPALTSNTMYVKDVVILEGDWTNNVIPSYFPGIQSVGESEGNKIVISSLDSSKNVNNTMMVQLSEPLRGFNDVYDTLDADAHLVTRNIGKVVLNGTESWSLGSATNQTTTLQFSVNLTDGMLGLSTTTPNILCDFIATASSAYNVATDFRTIAYDENGNVLFRIQKTTLPTADLAGLKTWLSSNNLTVYYILKTSTQEDVYESVLISPTKNGYIRLDNIIKPTVTFNYGTNVNKIIGDTLKVAYDANVQARKSISRIDTLKTYNALLLGFKPNDPTYDCTPLYQILMNSFDSRTVIHFPPGTYYWSELLVDSPNALIRGESIACGPFGTVFRPYQSDQRYVIKIGGYSDFSQPAYDNTVENYSGVNTLHGFEIIGVSFSDSNYPVTNSIIYIEYSSNLRFDIGFYSNKGTAVTIGSSWEIDFDNLYIRPNYPTAPQVVFADVIQDGMSNISRILFKQIDAEYVNTAPLMYSASNSNANNILIGNLSYEDVIPYVETDTANNTSYTLTQFLAFDKHPLFKLDFMHGLTINSMNMSGIGKRYVVSDTGDFVTSIFQLGNVNMTVGDINIDDCAYLWLADGAGSFGAVLTIGTLTSSFDNRIDGDWLVSSTILRILYCYYTMTKGVINIANTNFITNQYSVNNDVVLTVQSKIYDGIELTKVFKTLLSQSLVYDIDSLSTYVIKKDNADSITMSYNLTTSMNSKVIVRYKSDDPLLVVLTNNSDVTSTITLPASAVYTVGCFNFNPALYKHFKFTSLTNISIDYLECEMDLLPISYNKSSIANPSATIATYGTAVALTPSIGYSGLLPKALDIVFGGTFASETVTALIAVTYADGTTTSLTKTATAIGTISLSNSDLMSLTKDGTCIVSSFVSSKSSIASSTTTVTFNRCGQYI